MESRFVILVRITFELCLQMSTISVKIKKKMLEQGGGFARLSPELNQLEYLNLSYNTLSSGDLSSLTALPALSHLELSGCKVEHYSVLADHNQLIKKKSRVKGSFQGSWSSGCA